MRIGKLCDDSFHGNVCSAIGGWCQNYCLLINSYDEIQKQLAAQSNFLGCCFLAALLTLSHTVCARGDIRQKRSVRHESQGEVHL